MELVCALEGCKNTFIKRVHNQRFCGKECSRLYTNKRILEQYHTKRKRELKGRVCKQRGCKTILSQYNKEDVCALHERDQYISKLRKWGWNVVED